MHKPKSITLLYAALCFLVVCAVCTACSKANNEITSPSRLSAPGNLCADKGTQSLSWDSVANASGYIVEIDGIVHTTVLNGFDLSGLTVPKIYSIRVLAKGDGESYSDSAWSSFSYAVEPVIEPDPIIEPDPDYRGVTYTVTLPPDGIGYSVAPVEGFSSSVNHGGTYKFEVALLAGYTQSALVVKAAGVVLAPDEDGVYILKNVVGDKTVTVEGVTLNSYTVTLPFGAEYTIATVGGNALFVPHGGELSFDVTLSEEYAECSFLVKANGSLVRPDDGSYTVRNIAGNVAITVAVSGPGSPGLEYTLINDDTEYSVSVHGASGAVTIPFTYNCLPVTTIATDAVLGVPNDSIISVSIPAGVTSIGSRAFYGCLGLRDIELPESVTSIDNFAFYGCLGLRNIVLPESLTSIGNSAFYGSGLRNIDIPEGVMHIGSDAFRSNHALTVWMKSETPPAILSGTFGVITGVRAIVVPAAAVGAYKAAWEAYPEKFFSDADAAEGFLVDNGILRAYVGAQSTVVIPESVTEIGISAFDGYQGLVSVVMPTALTAIGSEAFSGCVNLESVRITGGVTSIGANAFSDCESLTDITISAARYLREGVFSGCTSLKVVILPGGLYSIGSNAFNGCTNLIAIYVPSGVNVPYEEFSVSAFPNCPKLTLYCGGSSISSSCPKVTGIGGISYLDGAIYLYTNNDTRTAVLLRYIGGKDAFSIPETVEINGESLPVKHISKDAFSDCTALISVVLPESIAGIGENAFKNCTALKSIVIPGNVEAIYGYAFENCTSLESVVFAKSSRNRYISIYYGVFRGCGALSSVMIPKDVRTLGELAFAACISLSSITLAENVNFTYQFPYERTFAACDNLTVYLGSAYKTGWSGTDRPVVWGCETASDDNGEYVKSWTKINNITFPPRCP